MPLCLACICHIMPILSPVALILLNFHFHDTRASKHFNNHISLGKMWLLTVSLINHIFSTDDYFKK